MFEEASLRNAEEVFEDHLRLAAQGNLDDDIARNVAEDIVVLTNFGVFRGHEGVREAAELLGRQLPNGKFTYVVKLCHEKICFLHWTGESEDTYVDDGADSFLIEDGVIKVQTISYTVKPKSGK